MTEPKEPTPDQRLATARQDRAIVDYAIAAATFEIVDMVADQANKLASVVAWAYDTAEVRVLCGAARVAETCELRRIEAHVQLVNAWGAVPGTAGIAEPAALETRPPIAPLHDLPAMDDDDAGPRPPDLSTRAGRLVAALLDRLKSTAAEVDGDRIVVSTADRAVMMAAFVAHFGLTIE